MTVAGGGASTSPSDGAKVVELAGIRAPAETRPAPGLPLQEHVDAVAAHVDRLVALGGRALDGSEPTRVLLGVVEELEQTRDLVLLVHGLALRAAAAESALARLRPQVGRSDSVSPSCTSPHGGTAPSSH
jgi:hypothetical protein